MKRFAYLKKDYINKYFCHELFHDVFILLPWSDIKQASMVCRLWHDHVQQMRNTLFRRYIVVLVYTSFVFDGAVLWYCDQHNIPFDGESCACS